MVSLFKTLLCHAIPTLGSIDCPCHFNGDIEVAAFDGQIEASFFVFNKVQCDLREFNKCFYGKRMTILLGTLSAEDTQ